MTASSGALLALACNQVAGLDGFKEVDCFEAPCVDAGLPDVEPGEAASDARLDAIVPDAEPIADAGVFEHRTWAHWKMPNPDAGGSPLLPNLMKYDAGADPGGEQVVFDRVTGLEWQLKVRSAEVLSFTEALNECAKPGSWRVPTRIELVTLLDFTRTNPALHSIFAAAPDTRYGGSNRDVTLFWTASAVAGQKGSYWAVDFNAGTVTATNKGRTVRCVRRGPDK